MNNYIIATSFSQTMASTFSLSSSSVTFKSLFFQVKVIDLFRKSELRMPLIVSIMMQLSQQLSGINAVRLCKFMNFTCTEMF